MSIPWLLIDFDSTFVTVESLELLAEIALNDRPAAERDAKLDAIRDLTTRGMAGHLPFAEALARRFELLQPRAEHLPALIAALKTLVSPSFRRHGDFIRCHAERIYIVSAGFHDYIAPVAFDYGIGPEHILANRLIQRADGTLDFDARQPLAADGGKVIVVRTLGLRGPAVAIGDGMSDLELGHSKLCTDFLAYTETVERPEVIRKAHRVAANFEAVLAVINTAESLR
ncbi:MAG: HAD-IB family phosphatase [Gammaproteobacteria bacterium]